MLCYCKYVLLLLFRVKSRKHMGIRYLSLEVLIFIIDYQSYNHPSHCAA